MSIAIDLDLFDQVPEASSASMMPNYSDVSLVKPSFFSCIAILTFSLFHRLMTSKLWSCQMKSFS